MAWKRSNFITLKDLYLAYRKAKVNMFYERGHLTAQAFCQYEGSLAGNLESLLNKLNQDSPTWFDTSHFVGEATYIPKDMVATTVGQSGSAKNVPQLSGGFITSNPDDAWRALSSVQPHTANFRLIGRHPVDFHIVSALWITKVGHKFDAKLNDSAYGTRLRRSRSTDDAIGKPTLLSMGNFKPYPHAFRTWRSDGFDAIRKALANGQHVVALTTDIRSFYHKVNPDYLVSTEFAEEFSLHLSPDERTFTSQLVQAIKTWSGKTSSSRRNATLGLPVGLSAARIIANVVLCGFDRFVERELSPLHYGRYVDDVFLVLNNTRGMKSAADVWKFMIERSNDILEETQLGQVSEYALRLPYALGSELVFGGDKQRVFALSGSSGESLLNAIERTVERLSSEWRMLPEVARETEDLITDFVAAGHDASEEVDNLRKSDGATVRRLAFALCLRNLEAMQRELLPGQWESYRNAFFRQVHDHVVTAQGLFAYGPYLPRLVGLAVASDDWNAATKIVRRIVDIFQLLRTTDVKTNKKHMRLCREHMLQACFEASAAALGDRGEVTGFPGEARAFFDAVSVDTENPFTLRQARELGMQLFERDLAREPFRESWLEHKTFYTIGSGARLEERLDESVRLALKIDDVKAFLQAAKLDRDDGVPSAAVFPTRPLRIAEMVELDQDCLKEPARLKRWAKALRGLEAKSWIQHDDRSIKIPYSGLTQQPSIALPCFETDHSSWTAAATSSPDPGAMKRYERLNHLVNQVLRTSSVQYLVLPELSLPRRWFRALAHKLAQSGVSLIAGVEYEHHPMTSPPPAGLPGPTVGFVSNQVWASLVTDAFGYLDHVTYIQEKERPASEEESDLWRVAGRVLRPINLISKPVIGHGKLAFGILICSELMNIESRSRFRGKIDILFVPEWNKDVGSFASLVEASALDMHCFVVQVNNRAYGDCRIRAPYRQEFRRDVARVKGGELDYFVIAKLETDELRRFQSYHRSPQGGKFKPTPDGFEIDPSRRDVPTSSH